jgi:hypothetical protein
MLDLTGLSCHCLCLGQSGQLPVPVAYTECPRLLLVKHPECPGLTSLALYPYPQFSQFGLGTITPSMETKEDV